MAENIFAENYAPSNITARTYLINDAEAAQNLIDIENGQSFVVGKKLVIGEGESAEIIEVDFITDQSITLHSNLKFRHIKGDLVRGLLGNVIEFFAAVDIDGTPPADGSFVSLAEVSIVADDFMTSYPHVAGGSGYWYKYIYKDLGTDESTELSGTVAIRGGDYGHLVSVEEIRSEAGLDNNPNITDLTISLRRSRAESLANGTCFAASYVMPLQTEAGVLYTPELIEMAVLSIASGLVLQKDWGPAAGDAGKEATRDGKSKVKQGMDILTGISAGTVALLGPDHQPLARVTDVAGWPDDTTQYSGNDGTPEPFQSSATKVF